MSIVGLDPRGTRTQPSGRAGTIAPRPVSLDGAVIGIVGNGLNRGNEFLQAVAREVGKLAAVSGEIPVAKHGLAVPPDPEDWQRLVSGATVAITGFGGCGSCSSRSMRDAIDLEAEAIPAVAIVHEGLQGAVKAIARLSHMNGYRFVMVPYPYQTIATWTDAEIAELSRSVAPAVMHLLTRRSEGHDESSPVSRWIGAA
jgi:hypothetical protein